MNDAEIDALFRWMTMKDTPVRFERLDEFAAHDEDAAESLIAVDEHESLLPADGDALLFGDAGSTKSTLANDLAVHAAAGLPWLNLFAVARPLRVALLENEGSRARFRLKLRRKAQTWAGPSFAERIFVYAEPWGSFTLAERPCREQLAAFLSDNQIDLLIAGPLAELGAGGAGTPDDVTEFGGFVADLRRLVGRPLALILIHHENKSRDVSGAWSRLPDTLIHVRSDQRERTTLHLRKCRHSSRAHGAEIVLRWVRCCEGFEVIKTDLDGGERTEQEAGARKWIASYVADQYARTGIGVPRGKVETAFHEAHDKTGRNLAPPRHRQRTRSRRSHRGRQPRRRDPHPRHRARPKPPRHLPLPLQPCGLATRHHPHRRYRRHPTAGHLSPLAAASRRGGETARGRRTPLLPLVANCS